MKTTLPFSQSHWRTVVIGAGQAGLAAGYYLRKSGENFILLESNQNVGDSWRNRWDTLRLFTPAQYDGLPGFPFPAARGSFPEKDQVADYLVEYATRFDLPVHLGVKVGSLEKKGSGFEISTSVGSLTADRVVVATGTNPVPWIPDFASELDPTIHQIHSSQYKNPSSLPDGDVLVVGAGTSGLEIALEIAGSRTTLISGKPTFHIPDTILRYAGGFYWWFINNVLTVRTPVGKKARIQILSHGGPLINISAGMLDTAGVKRLSKIVGVKNGFPVTDDGQVLKVKNVIWCTGFRPDFSWISPGVTDHTGWPVTQRGVTSLKGLYFVGMLFQYGLTSGLIGGVGRDAANVVRHMRAMA